VLTDPLSVAPHGASSTGTRAGPGVSGIGGNVSPVSSKVLTPETTRGQPTIGATRLPASKPVVDIFGTRGSSNRLGTDRRLTKDRLESIPPGDGQLRREVA
jgi:hypothetical protein